MKDYLIISSFTTDEGVSQASMFHITTFLKNMNLTYDVLDVGGNIDYYDPPEHIYSELNKALWLKKELFDEEWIDSYIPKVEENKYDIILCSALFSLDIIFQGGYVKRYKEKYKGSRAVIGGAALKNLSKEQYKVIASVFDEIYTHDIINNPDYSLLPIDNFITVMTGSGCNWKKCKFCNSGKQIYYLRDLDNIVNDFIDISELSPNTEIMLSSDSIPIKDLKLLMTKLKRVKNKQKYNFMVRASNEIDKDFSLLVKESSCTDVFVGVEIFDDKGLRTINKGINVDIIKKSVINLSHYTNIHIGLILFLPHISQKQLDKQLKNLEELLPYVDNIELETLSILQGSEFHKDHKKYGIQLFPKSNLIFDYWCYGLSPDVPWTFKNKNKLNMWFKHIEQLKNLLNNHVDDQYWEHTDYIKEGVI